MSDRVQHVAVIGAGIVGTCIAIEMRRRGVDVTLMDRGGAGDACSFGNAGILGMQSCVPFALPGIASTIPSMLFDPKSPLALRREGLTRTLPWMWRFLRTAYDGSVTDRADAMKALYGNALDLHEQLAREAGVPDLVRETYYLHLFDAAEKADVETGLAWKLRRERGARITRLSSGEIRELEPEISEHFTHAVRFGPIGHTVNPHRLTQAYAALFERMGGIMKRTRAIRIIPSGARPVVVTDQGDVVADKIVVAAGSWSLDLLRPLGASFPLIAERGYHLTFAEPGIKLDHVLNEPSRHVAISSMEMGLRIAGTEELGDADAAPDWRRADVLKAVVAAVLPRADLSRPSRWMGPRPGTPDSLPVIGSVPGNNDIIVATGHGHLGLTGGPMTARIVAAQAMGERLNIDLAPYSFERFRSARVPKSSIEMPDRIAG